MKCGISIAYSASSQSQNRSNAAASVGAARAPDLGGHRLAAVAHEQLEPSAKHARYTGSIGRYVQ
jgi:hypothetical protein